MTRPEPAGGEPETRAQSPHHSRRQEVRIGLVLYGGVSLAVYINGAAREFFDMVRGRGIWGVIKELSDSDIVVDIVSGASAGGINGLYLSYALCAEREFEPLARLWREKAGFQSLLQKVNDGDARSLLDSAYMERELANAFRTMERAPCNTDQELDAKRAPEELDCFLAVTNYDGHGETIGDLRQRPLRVTSHASKLHIRHRRGRREPFGDGQVAEKIPADLLARFARATSAFPVAFEPAVLRAQDAGRFFARPGPGLEPGSSANFIDGGVLSNKPFTPVLPAIYERHATRPVERVLFFVEPNPEEAEPMGAPSDPLEATPEGPNFFQVALAALTSLPSYESISEDLKALDAHNRRIDLIKTVFGSTYGEGQWEGRFDHPPQQPSPCPPEQQRAYYRARLHGLIESAAREMSPRAIADIEDELLAEGERAAPGSRFEALFPKLCEKLDLGCLLENPEKVPEAAHRQCASALDDLDLAFHKRAFYYWIYALHEALETLVKRRWELTQGSPEADCAKLDSQIQQISRALGALSARVDMLLIVEAAIDWELQKMLQEHEAKGERVTVAALRDLWRQCLTSREALQRRVKAPPEAFPASGSSDAPPHWGAEATDFAEAFSERPTGGDLAAPGNGADGSSLLATFREALDDLMAPFWGLGAGHAADSNAAPTALEIFRRVDCWRFPVLLTSQLAEMDRIDYVRISPRDSVRVEGSDILLSRWDDDPITKVNGRHLAHFGAFLKRSWRSNDIMWGRIDAATIAYDTLVGTARQGRLSLSRARAQALLADPERLAKLHPEIQSTLKTFARDGDDAAFRKALLAHHQRQICREGLLTVLADAVAEERIRANPELGPAAQEPQEPAASTQPAPYQDRFHDAVIEVLRQFRGNAHDPLLRTLTEATLPSLTPAELDAFFREHYSVGEEGLSDLDRVGLATMALHSVRVFTNMCRRLLPERGIWDRLNRGALRTGSAAVTTLHLGLRSIRNGSFPMVWFASLIALGLALVANLVSDHRSAPFAFLLAFMMLVLLVAPRLWFGRLRGVRWFALLVVLAVTFSWLLHGGRELGSAVRSWIPHATEIASTLAARPATWWAAAAFAVALLGLALWRRRTRPRRRWRAFLRTTADLGALDREAIALDRKIEALEQRKRELDERRTAVTQDQDQRAAKTSASPGPGDPALAEGSHGL